MKVYRLLLLMLITCSSNFVFGQESPMQLYNSDTSNYTAISQNYFSNVIEDIDAVHASGELSLSEYLQGRIAGLDVISASGNIGRSLPMIIQGLNISGNHHPLIVIDGIPQYKIENRFNDYNEYSENVHRLISVAMEDILSLKVIKNPSATVLYGAEGVDGVIEIKTKNNGSKALQVDYRYSIGFHAKPQFPEMLDGDEYATLQLEGYFNMSGHVQMPSELAYDPDFEDYHNYSANTDWLEEVTQVGISKNHYLSIYGKSDKIRYSTSFDYKDQTGTVINTGHTRLLNRTKLDAKLSDKLSIGLSLTYAKDNYQDEFDNGKSILEMACVKSPNMSVWEYDSDGNKTDNYFAPEDNYQGNGYNYYNPVAVSHLGDLENSFSELTSTFYAKYSVKDWFGLRDLFTYNGLDAYSRVHVPSAAFSNESSLFYQDIEREFVLETNRYRNEMQALLKAPFKSAQKHQLSAQLGWIYQSLDFKPKREKHAVSSAIHYKLNNRYLFDVNTFFESFSKSGYDQNLDSHFGAFLGWDFLKESFMSNLSFMSEGLLRSGFGVSEFNWLNHNISKIPTYWTTNNGIPLQSIIGPTFLSQQNIKSYYIGLDLAFFNDKLSVSNDYFSRSVMTESFAYSENDILNTGFETTIKWQVIRTQDYFWNLDFNMAKNSFKLAKLDGYPPYGLSTLFNNRFLSSVDEGESPGRIYGLESQGVFPSSDEAFVRNSQGNILLNVAGDPMPLSYRDGYLFKGGDVRYSDVNHDGVIDDYDVKYLGNSYPKLVGGMSSHFSYKSLTLVMNFHYKLGYEIINQLALDTESMDSKHNQSASTINRWQKVGDNGDLLHKAYYNHPANNLGSDLYVESGNFFKMNYISLGYKFNPELCKKMHLRNVYLSLSAQRLFTVTDYTGIDAETVTKYSELDWQRKDEIRNYPTRVYSLKVQVGI